MTFPGWQKLILIDCSYFLMYSNYVMTTSTLLLKRYSDIQIWTASEFVLFGKYTYQLQYITAQAINIYR